MLRRLGVLAFICVMMFSCGLKKEGVSEKVIGLDSVGGFKTFSEKVRPELIRNCQECHVSQFPTFATNDAHHDFEIASRYVDFNGTGMNSRLTLYSSNGHCSAVKCQLEQSLLGPLIDEWIEDSKQSGTTNNPPSIPSDGVLSTQVTVPASIFSGQNTEVSVAFVVPAAGATIESRLRVFADGFQLSNTKVKTGNCDVFIKSILPILNGVLINRAGTYSGISAVFRAGTTSNLITPDIPNVFALDDHTSAPGDNLALYFQEIRCE